MEEGRQKRGKEHVGCAHDAKQFPVLESDAKKHGGEDKRLIDSNLIKLILTKLIIIIMGQNTNKPI